MVKGAEVSNDVSMHIGDTTAAGSYTFRFVNFEDNILGPNYTAKRGTFEVTHNGSVVAIMKPEKRAFVVQHMEMTIAAIDRGFTRDLYVSLGEPGNDGAWVVRVQHKPFVSWIWSGCIIIAFGGFLAASDKRYRLAKKRAAQQIDNAVPA